MVNVRNVSYHALLLYDVSLILKMLCGIYEVSLLCNALYAKWVIRLRTAEEYCDMCEMSRPGLFPDIESFTW